MAIEKTIDINVDSKDAVKGIENINYELNQLDKGAIKAEKGVGGISKGFKGLGTAIKAAGIGLVIAAFGKLAEVFNQNQKVADTFNTVFEAVSIAFNDFVNFVVDNGGEVVDFFKAIFENPLESVKELGESIKANIVERFESFLDTLGYLASAVKKVFSGDFAGALDDVKSAGKESLDVLTGVNNTFDKGAEFVEKTTKAIKNYTTETIKSAKENVKLAKAAELAAVKNQGLIEKYDRQAESLRQIRDDESKSIEERIKANEDLAKVLDDQEKAMKDNAAILVAAAAAELEKNKESIELQKAYQEALNEQAAIEAQITGFRSEQQTNVNSLLREQKEIQKELALIGKSERDIQRAELLQQYEEQKEIIDRQVTDEVEKNNLLLEAKRVYDEQLLELNKQFNDEDLELQKQKDEAEKKSINEKAELERLRKEQTLADAKGTFDQIANLAGKDSKIGKAMALASATISGVEGVQNAYTTAQKSPITTFFPAYPVVQAALAGAVAAQNIAAIKSVDSSGKGGGSVPTTTAASQPPQFNIVGATETSQLAEAVAGQTQEPVQAYVVANDVTTAQSLENNIVEGATLINTKIIKKHYIIICE
jgi:hypothetical protein